MQTHLRVQSSQASGDKTIISFRGQLRLPVKLSLISSGQGAISQTLSYLAPKLKVSAEKSSPAWVTEDETHPRQGLGTLLGRFVLMHLVQLSFSHTLIQPEHFMNTSILVLAIAPVSLHDRREPETYKDKGTSPRSRREVTK